MLYARVARFKGDPATVQQDVSHVRSQIQAGPPPGLEGAKMMMLVDPDSGAGLGVTLFESEDAMRRGDEVLNAMNPGSGGTREGVDFYQVPVDTL